MSILYQDHPQNKVLICHEAMKSTYFKHTLFCRGNNRNVNIAQSFSMTPITTQIQGGDASINYLQQHLSLQCFNSCVISVHAIFAGIPHQRCINFEIKNLNNRTFTVKRAFSFNL